MEAVCLQSVLRVIFSFIVITTVFIFDIEQVHVAGRRSGGGRSSSSRSSSSRSSSTRLSGSSSSRSVRVDVHVGSSRSHRYYSRPWGYGYGYSYNSWRSYGAAGHIYGYTYYTRTRRYHDYPDREPQICYNSHDYFDSDNGTEYEYFICPNAYQSDDYHYCCGDDDKQKCCRFWDSGMRVFGVVSGLLAFLFISAITVYCCCYRRPQPTAQPFFQSRVLSRRHTASGRNVQYTVASTGPPVVNINPPIAGPPGTFQQNDQPMYPVSPLEPKPADSNLPTNGFPMAQPTAPGEVGGSAEYPAPTMSPPPPYCAAAPYPAVPFATAPYPSGPYLPPSDPNAYPSVANPPGSYPPDPAAIYPSAPYPASYPPMPPGSVPYPEVPPAAQLAPAAYASPPYPVSDPSYPVSPVPPYNMK